MYGSYNGSIVYGWWEGEPRSWNECHRRIHGDWLYDHGIDDFAIDVVKDNSCLSYMYGLKCDLDETTGLVTLPAKAKLLVKAAHRASGSGSTLGYHTAVSGDYDGRNDRVYVPKAGPSDDHRSSPPAENHCRTDGDDGDESS